MQTKKVSTEARKRDKLIHLNMESLYKILEIQTFTNTKNQPFENAVLIFQDVNHAINIKTVTVKKSWCYIPENNKLVHMILTSEEIDRIAANQKQTNG